MVEESFPLLMIVVSVPTGQTTLAEYFFRFELSGFPGVAPAAFLWDVEVNAPLQRTKRPGWSRRVTEAFKEWQPPHHPVYRPWERTSGAHHNWAQSFPQLAWNPSRTLSFVLEDLHGLLTSQRLTSSSGTAA